jgi:hypothetical protein
VTGRKVDIITAGTMKDIEFYSNHFILTFSQRFTIFLRDYIILILLSIGCAIYFGLKVSTALILISVAIQLCEKSITEENY